MLIWIIREWSMVMFLVPKYSLQAVIPEREREREREREWLVIKYFFDRLDG